MKRFWTEVSSGAEGNAHVVRLDGKPLRLPGGALLGLVTAALAQAVAAEWAAAGADGRPFGPVDTPLTGLAGTAQERVAPDPEPFRDAIAAYGASDVICYFAERPETLIARQVEAWEPWLLYAADTLGAPLRTTRGIGFVEQPAESLAMLRGHLADADPFVVAALGVAVPALGSLVLGLALARGDASPAEALAAATLDERAQAEQWGRDAEAKARAARIAADVAGAARFIALTR